MLRMGEDAWYYVTKGEIDPDEDEKLRDLILALYRWGRENVERILVATITPRAQGVHFSHLP